MPKQILALLSALFLFACSDADSSGPSASGDAWSETKLETAVESGDWESVQSALGTFSPKPNLRDLHAGDGALSQAARTSGPMTVSILEEIGAEVELTLPRKHLGDGAFAQGTFVLEGRNFSLSGPADRSQIEWPTTRHRVLTPAHSATVAMRSDGKVRVTDGEQMSVPVSVADVGVFATNWTQRYPAATVDTAAPDGEVIGLSAGGAAAALEAVGARAAGNAVRLGPASDATVADLTAFLDGALGVSKTSPLPLAVQLGETPGRTVSLSTEPLDAPILTLKLDRQLPWSEVLPVLEQLQPKVSLVLIQTLQDVSDPDGLDLGGLPRGLPGGVLLPL